MRLCSYRGELIQQSLVEEHAIPVQVACSIFAHAYKVGVRNLPHGQSALQFAQNQLYRLGIGAEVKRIPLGRKQCKLPPSNLTQARVRREQ